MEKSQVSPRHIGFIVDGNRRWAKKRNLSSLEGHKEGLKKIKSIIKAIAQKGIPFASFYIFSTENWNRSKEEVSHIMNLIREEAQTLSKIAKENNLKCVFLSSDNGKISQSLRKKLQKIELDTENCTGGTICLCFNYGGQQEIADAARQIAENKEKFTPENLEKYLYHPEVPPCDLIVRTSGEERLSGFMLWRAAYAELLFLKKFWPDIEPADLDSILAEFKNRSRRFGH